MKRPVNSYRWRFHIAKKAVVINKIYGHQGLHVTPHGIKMPWSEIL